MKQFMVMTFCILVLQGCAISSPHVRNGFGPWEAWQPTGLGPSYFNLFPSKNGEIELWFGANVNDADAVIGLVGSTLSDLERLPPKFDATIVSGYDRHLKEQPSRTTPIISRTSATRLKNGSYVVLTNIGPSYRGGASELYPALFISPNGKVGTWKHIGAPKGEPQQWLDEARLHGRKIRCEGGSIIELPDGKLRMYTRGYGVGLALAEADQVEGPWTFLRDDASEIRDLQNGLPGGEWLFPFVMKIGDHGYLLTGGNTWPPTEMWAAYSKDGIHFEVLEAQPSLLPNQIVPSAITMKCLRGYYDFATGKFIAAANVWDEKNQRYALYWSQCSFDLRVFDKLIHDK